MPSDCSCLKLSASKLDLYLAVDDCSWEVFGCWYIETTLPR